MADLTYNDMLDAYCSYPAAIRKYLLRAETHPEIRTRLSKSAMRILVDLVSRARIRNPQKEILVKISNVAAKFDVDRRTVGRAISTFMELDWLCPNPSHDGRNWLGKFAARQYLITDRLRALVGLPVVRVESEPETDESTPASTDVIEADGQPAGTQANAAEMSHGHIGVNNCLFKKEASFNKMADKPRGLPADLLPLHRELGIELPGIFALMKQAKAVGQRLQDLWAAKRHLLSGSTITGGRAVAYFRSLLSSGEDFSYVARTRYASPGARNKGQVGNSIAIPPTTPPAAATQVSHPYAAIAEACKFKRYQHVHRDISVRFYDGTAEVTNGAVRETYAGDMMIGLYRGIEAGNLVEATA